MRLKVFRHGISSPLQCSYGWEIIRSIRAAMQMAYDRGDDSVVVCEDDAFFSPVFTEVLEAIEQLDPRYES